MAGPLTDGTIADGPNGPIILRGGRWVPLTAAPSAANAPGSIGGVFIPKAPKTREAPTGYRWNGNNLEVIPGGPADKQITSQQAPSGYRFKKDGSGDLEPIPGGPQDAGSTKIPGDPTKTGPAYLITLPQNVRARVQQLIDGRSMLTQREKGQPFGQMLMDAANQADPTFDEAASRARYAARLQFTGQGKGSQIVQAADRFAAHVNDLYNLSNKLPGPNLGFAPLSNVATEIGQSFDQKDLAAYNQILPAIQGEIQKLTKNGSATVDEGERIMNGLKAGQPRDVRNAAIAELVSLGRAQIQPLRDAWESAWAGSVAPPMPMDFSPATQAIFDAIENGQPGLTRKQDKGGKDHWYYADGTAIGDDAGGRGGAPPSLTGNPPSPLDPGGGGPPDRAVATGATKRVFDAETAAGLNALVQKGRPYNEAAAFVQSKGFPPPTPGEYAAALAWQKNNPNTPYNAADPTRTEPVSLLDQSRATGPGQLLAGIASAGTAGFDDELKGALAAATGGDYTQARDAAQADKEIGAAMHPGYDLAGNVLGGAGMMLAPEMLAGKFAPGALALASRGAAKLGKFATPLGDAAYGALYGAGEDNNDRVGGAATGAITAPLAGYGARKAVGGLANVISPPAGNFAPLYEQGVFPTIGQRFGKSGLAGRILNTTEQALQSFPLLGSMVAKSRQGARDAYQLGGFNEALGEINQSLPAGMRPGTEAHSFASDAFDEAYDNARGGMTFAPDKQYLGDLTNYQQMLQSGLLDAQQADQVSKVIQNSVGSRLSSGGGVLNGDAYKAAASDLAETQRQWAKSDPLKANALSDYLTIFDDAARRNSDPQAVAALDQADRGYAKLVRLQRASEMGGAGKDAGTFTPLNLASAAKQTAGGVRSGPYLRGDALMQDYADAGRGLADTLPNSGTSERLMTGQVVAGGAGTMAGVPGALAAHPGALAPFALYAPGVDAVVKRMIAPRSVTLPPNLASAADNLALQVNQRAPAIGRLAVPAALNWWEVGQ